MKWEAELFSLLVLEGAYLGVLVVVSMAVPVLAVVVARGRSRGVRRPLAARLLLLGVSILISAGLAEAGAGLWEVLARRPVISTLPPTRKLRPLIRPEAIGSEDLPTEFVDDGDRDGTIDLVVIGESSAAGVPFNLFGLSMGRIVANRLQDVLAGRSVRLELLAASGDTLEGQSRGLVSQTRRPDVLIVYAGHNEFSSRMPWSRAPDYYPDRAPPTAWERITGLAERVSPVCRRIHSVAERCRIAIPPRRGSERNLVDVPGFTKVEFQALLDDFSARLERIVGWAESVGAVPVLVVPSANDAGFEPNRSYLPATLRHDERARFAAEFLAIRADEEADPQGCIDRYRELLGRYPTFAEAHYRLGLLLDEAGDEKGAYGEFVRARDLDGLPMRLPSAFQQVYHAVAERHRSLLVDSQVLFHAIGRDGQLDDLLFVDAMHPSLRGQVVLAESVLRGLREADVLDWPDSEPVVKLDPARIAEEFGLDSTAWAKLCTWVAVSYDAMAPAHYDPSARKAKLLAYLKGFQAIEAGKPPGKVGLPNIGRYDPIPEGPAPRWTTGVSGE